MKQVIGFFVTLAIVGTSLVSAHAGIIRRDNGEIRGVRVVRWVTRTARDGYPCIRDGYPCIRDGYPCIRAGGCAYGVCN